MNHCSAWTQLVTALWWLQTPVAPDFSYSPIGGLLGLKLPATTIVFIASLVALHFTPVSNQVVHQKSNKHSFEACKLVFFFTASDNPPSCCFAGAHCLLPSPRSSFSCLIRSQKTVKVTSKSLMPKAEKGANKNKKNKDLCRIDLIYKRSIIQTKGETINHSIR